MMGTERFPVNSIVGVTGTVMKGGAVGMEIDVMLTLDGEVVLMHDHVLETTTDCSGCVSESTLAEVAACRCKPVEYGATPPTLASVVAAVSKLPVAPLLMLDVKSDPWREGCGVTMTPDEHRVRLGRRIGETLLDSGYAANVGVQSNSPELLAAVRELAPEALLLVYNDQIEPAVRAARAGELDGVAVWEDGLNRPWLDEARGSGMFVDTFTVNAPIDLAIAVEYEVDVIETDFVPEILASFD